MQTNDPVSSIVPVDEDGYISHQGKPIPVDKNTDPSAVIRTTQSIRLGLLESRLKRGFSDDGKEVSIDLQLLRDLDNAALTTRKIDVEERQVGDSERLAEAHNALMRMLSGRNPFAVDITDPSLPVVPRQLPHVELPEPDLVPGVTAQGTQPVNYDDFASSLGTAVSDDDSDDGVVL